MRKMDTHIRTLEEHVDHSQKGGRYAVHRYIYVLHSYTTIRVRYCPIGTMVNIHSLFLTIRWS